MSHYRFYKLTPDDHISSGSDYEFTNDKAALAAAMRMLTDTPLEVWQGTRIVFRLLPSDKAANDLERSEEQRPNITA